MTVAAVVLVSQGMSGGTEELRGALPPGGRLVLADFGNDTRDSLVAGVVTEALRIDLERYLHAALADPSEVARVLARMRRSPLADLTGDDAREVALRAGIPAVIDGRVGAVGSGFVLSAWIVASEDARIVDAAMATARDSTELVDAIENLSRQLREKIRPSVAPLLPPAPLAQVTTTSLEALRKYSQAERVWQDASDAPRALHLLEEATTLDSTFAMAYRRRAIILMNFAGTRREWIEALTKAYRHRDHLTDPERYITEAVYYQSAAGDREAATRAYEELLALDSLDLPALNNLGVLYRDLGDYPRAERMLRRCVAADSLSLTCALNLCGLTVALGRRAEAVAIVERLARELPNNPFVAAQFGHLAAAEQDYAAADTLYAALARFDLPAPALLEVWLGRVDMVRGRVAEARTHQEAAYRMARGSSAPAALRALFDGAWMELAITRDTARAVEAMEAALRDSAFVGLDPLDMPYLEVADFFVDAGRPRRAAAFVEAYLTDVPAEWRGPEDRWLYVVRGRLAMTEGRLEEAGDAFDIAESYPGNALSVLQYVGPLHAQAGRPDSAIVAYERYLSVGMLARLDFDSACLPEVLQTLAELHEARGHRVEAAGYYNRFADLWSGADPELRPRAEEARRRALALSSGGVGPPVG